MFLGNHVVRSVSNLGDDTLPFKKLRVFGISEPQ